MCTGEDVVVVVMDACPHNHPENCRKCPTGNEQECWCVKDGAMHMDLGCDAYWTIAKKEDNLWIDWYQVEDDHPVGPIRSNSTEV